MTRAATRVLTHDIGCADATHALLGEAPFWDAEAQALFWVDIYGRRIHRLHPASGATRSWLMPDRVACAVPRAAGGLLVALARELALFDPEAGTLRTVLSLGGHEPRVRFNDSRTDALGRLWIGTMNEVDEAPVAALLRLDPDLSCTAMEAGIRISNGIAISPDDRVFYFADSPERVIRAYDFDLAAGQLGARRDLISLDEAGMVPDGSAVDVEGCLWNAQWDGGRVVRYGPDGRVREIVAMPCGRPTSCVFGGPDLSTLYVTSSCMELSAAALRGQPLAGSLFAFEAGVAGTPCARFAG